MGLYRNDRLFLLGKINKKKLKEYEKKKSVFSKIYEIVTNLTKTDFLDVTFNLANKTHR